MRYKSQYEIHLIRYTSYLMSKINRITKLFHNQNAFEDLGIDQDIFTVIDRTITKFGKIKLHHRLAYCSADIGTLQNMTEKLYTMHLDYVYVDKMKRYLHQIRLIEDSVDKWILNQCNTDLVYGWNIFNNRYLLSVTNKLKFSSLLIVLVFYILVFLYLYYHNIMTSPTAYVKGIVTGYYEFSKLIFYLMISDKLWIERSALILTCLYVGWQLYLTYQSVNTCYEHYGTCNAFYEEYEKTQKYIDVAEQMCKYDTYNDNHKVMDAIKYLKYYFTEDVSLGFSLVAKLDAKTYTKQFDIVTNFIGRIDYQIANTSLLDEGYTVPSFVPAAFPILHVDGVWNPCLSPEVRIKNSLAMNVTKPNVMIITGPNKAGKSTFMRSIMTCVYLAHSLGICCADRMSLTPFRDMFTYLNVPDCVGRESLFEAEINRCYNYIEKTENLRGFSLGIVDELFTGTNPKEGKAGSYAILKRISNNPTNITVLSTHFHDILSRLDNEKFIFNKFTAKKIKNQYIYDYQIQEGISDQCIALELLRERGFDKSVMDDAFSFIEKEKK